MRNNIVRVSMAYVCGMCLIALVVAYANKGERPESLQDAPPSEHLKVDIGERVGGEVVQQVIKLENPTYRVRQISEIRTSCHCTVLEPMPKEVPARGLIDVNVKVNLPRADKPFMQVVNIKYDDGASAEILIAGNVFQLYLSEIDLGTLKKGENVERSTLIKDRNAGEAVISGLVYNKKVLNVTVKPRYKGTGEALLTVRLAEGVLPQSISEAIEFNLNGVESRIDVSGLVLDVVRLETPTLSFGLLKPGEQAIKNVVVVSTDNNPVHVESVKIDPGGIATCDESAMAATGSKVELPIRFTPRASSEVVNGVIKVTVETYVGKRELTARVYGVVR